MTYHSICLHNAMQLMACINFPESGSQIQIRQLCTRIIAQRNANYGSLRASDLLRLWLMLASDGMPTQAFAQQRR